MATATGKRVRTDVWKCGSCDRTVEVAQLAAESPAHFAGLGAPYPAPDEDGWAEVQVRVYTEDEPVKRYYAHVCPDHVPGETWKP